MRTRITLLIIAGVISIAGSSRCQPLQSNTVTVGFEQYEYNITEPDYGDEEIGVCVIARSTSKSFPHFSVLVNTHVGVADEGDYFPLRDYTVGPFHSDSRVHCFTITIIDDANIEGNETFTVTLDTTGLPSNVGVDSNHGVALIRIKDSDELPGCDNYLRLFFPDRFEHCDPSDCTYGSWSEWRRVPDTTVDISPALCESGKAVTRTRSITAPENGCEPITDTRQTCLPTNGERLSYILNLGINDFSNQGGPGTRRKREVQDRNHPTPFTDITIPGPNCPGENTGYVCDGVSNDPDDVCNFPTCSKNRNEDCPIHTILFMLDTSDSIGLIDFKNMTSLLSDLVPLMCNRIQVGVMTFSHTPRLEFCFNCFNNDFSGRAQIQNSIKTIPFRGGSTQTGPATRCAYTTLLDSAFGCGIHPQSNCIDIVYITDGRSHGPLRYPQLCEEIQCLQNHPEYCDRTKVYSIGIGDSIGILDRELRCIAGGDDDSIFNLKGGFCEFYEMITTAKNRLLTWSNDGNQMCINKNRGEDRKITFERFL